MDTSDGESSDSDVPEVPDRHRRYAELARRMLTEKSSIAPGAMQHQFTEDVRTYTMQEGRRATVNWCLGFLTYSALSATILYLACTRQWPLCAALTPSALFFVAFEICVAWTDRSIVALRWELRRRSARLQCLLLDAWVLLGLGCLFGFHLLRARRSFRRRGDGAGDNFLTELEALDPSRKLLAGSLRWDSFDLLWLPPVAVALTWQLAQSGLEADGCFLLGALLCLTMLCHTATAVRFDSCASQKIREQYGLRFDNFRWVRRVASANRLRVVEILHPLFRFLEILGRLLVLGVAVALLPLPLAVALAFADFLVGAAALCARGGSRGEALLAGLAFFLVDIVRFVDEPGYAMPARRASRLLAGIRMVEAFLAAFGCVYAAGRGELWALWVLPLLPIAHLGCQLSLRLSELGTRRGDLFTAVAAGDKAALEWSLGFDGGCTTEMVICDGSRRTALHVAVAYGHAECVAILLKVGADPLALDWRGDAPLHVACRRGDVEVAEALLSNCQHPGAAELLQQKSGSGELPRDLISRRARARFDSMMERVASANGIANGLGFDRLVSRRRSSGVQVMQSARKSLLYGELIGSETFHLWAGPRKQVGRLELANFLLVRGMGEQTLRLKDLTLPTLSGSPVCLSYLQTVGTLGAGGFGKVMKVQDIRDREYYAMKLQNKNRATKQALREASAMHSNRHPYIVGLAHVFHTTVFYGILLEFCERDLNVRIISHAEETGSVTGLPEQVAARYSTCIMLALEHLHSRYFLFRDLKPENVLITSKEKGDHAKLADFGLARSIAPPPPPAAPAGEAPSGFASAIGDAGGNGVTPLPSGGELPAPRRRERPKLTEKAGTLAFMSEEALGQGGDSDSEDASEPSFDFLSMRDWYGLGCCLLLMLLGERGGRSIYQGKHEVLLPARQRDVLDVLIQAMDQELISEEAFDLVSSLTSTKARDRGNSQVMRQSPLLQGAIAELEPPCLCDHDCGDEA
eukprot:TRINITY_DN26408_c0_g1_i1.p1 TRINITY_DN26408_c0_g1~~TRINITY_DN26408_c0_g1_i1.p1  ORF type:complete len:1106 (+),score=218.49 TRINITY_DN26408_c0_g1_i1:382-3318(+)